MKMADDCKIMLYTPIEIIDFMMPNPGLIARFLRVPPGFATPLFVGNARAAERPVNMPPCSLKLIMRLKGRHIRASINQHQDTDKALNKRHYTAFKTIRHDAAILSS